MRLAGYEAKQAMLPVYAKRVWVTPAMWLEPHGKRRRALTKTLLSPENKSSLLRHRSKDNWGRSHKMATKRMLKSIL